MKQFIGNVNGVEYTDKDTFNEAVKKAMENYEGTLVITSYEKDVPDKVDEVPVLPEKKLIVEENDFVIERESDKEIIDGETYFVIPKDVAEKIKNCDNRDDVEMMLRKYTTGWNRFLCEDEKNLITYEEEVKKLQTKIEQKKKDIDEDKAGIRYYNTLLGYLNGRKPGNEVCECGYKNPVGKVDCSGLKREAKDVVNELFDNMSSLFGDTFGSFLRKKGFF